MLAKTGVQEERRGREGSSDMEYADRRVPTTAGQHPLLKQGPRAADDELRVWIVDVDKVRPIWFGRS